MNFKTLLPIAGAVLIGGLTTAAIAGGHLPIEQREAAMKAVSGSAKTIGDMLKGTTDFDAAKANAALASMKDAVANFGDYFPEGTELQGENEFKASPAIWTDRAGFDAKLATFQGALDAGVAANPQDKEALAAVFGTIGQNCQSCHEDYRVKQ